MTKRTPSVIFANLLKSFFIIGFILSTTLNFQPASAMDENEEQTQQGKTAVLINPTMPEDAIDNRPSIFRNLPKDVSLIILSYLCKDELALENLSAVARACHKDNQLSKDTRLWKPLQKTYFNHLPEEYVSTLIEDENLPPLAQVKSLMECLLSFQSEELKRLNKVLSKRYWTGSVYNDHSKILLENISPEFKKSMLKELGDCTNINKSKKYTQMYFDQEKSLDHINTSIIKECLKFLKPEIGQRGSSRGWKNFKNLNINLKGTITRLPAEGIDAIKDIVFFADADATIKISLACNDLRWLPGELFLVSRMKQLDLRNNLLLYLPPSIEESVYIKIDKKVD